MRLETRFELSLEVGFLILSPVFKRTRWRERQKEREHTVERNLPKKESKFGVFAIAVQVLSPQKFTLENLAQVLEVNYKIKYILPFFPYLV